MTPLNQKFLQLTIPPLQYTIFIGQGISLDRDETYWEQLPTYLISRCPLCGAIYTDKLDTHSLDGWGTHDTAWGDYFATTKYQQVGCEHRLTVQKFVNLEETIPSELSGYVAHLHVPFVTPFFVPDDIPSAIAVIHSFAICRLEDERGRVYDHQTHAFCEPLTSVEVARSREHSWREKRRIEERSVEDTAALEHAVFVPRYTAYAVTYYADKQDHTTIFSRRMRPQMELEAEDQEYESVWLAAMGEMHSEPHAFDLRYWVDKGKLQWLDLESPDLPLKAGPATDFPYVDIQFDWGQLYRMSF